MAKIISELAIQQEAALPSASAYKNQLRVQGGKLWFSDGATWIELGASGGGGSMTYRKQATFTSSGTFTLPSTALPAVEVLIRGGGGGGGGAGGDATPTNSCGSGGGGGERIEWSGTLVPGDSYSVTVGAGGAGGYLTQGSTGGYAPSNGGSSSISGVITARGGGAGKNGRSVNDSDVAGGAAGSGARAVEGINTGGFSSTSSTPGSQGYYQSWEITGVADHGECSGGMGARNSGYQMSRFHGAGAGATTPGNGGSATVVGCGGGGARDSYGTGNYYGGDGYRGQVDIIYWDTVL